MRRTALAGAALLLLAMPTIALAGIPPEFKQLAGPPSEMSEMAPPDPVRSATRSKSALLPVVLEEQDDGRWTWQSDIPVEGETLRFVVFSGPQTGAPGAWKVTLRDPLSASAQSEAAQHLTGRSTEVGLSDKGVPTDVYELKNMVPGSRQVSIESKEPGQGFLVIEGAGPVRLLSHQAAFNQRVGQRIVMLASAIGGDRVGEATLRVTTPDMWVLNVNMFDDGLHGDGEAGDKLYGGSFMADRPGDFNAQVVFRGQDSTGIAFVRTVEHLIPVVADKLTLQKTAAEATQRGEHRLGVRLRASVVGASGHYRAFAEVWGAGSSGTATSRPVAWIGGMTTIENGVLELGLDTRWIAMSGAQAPFELRNVRIEEPDYFITLASAERIPLAVPAMPDMSLAVDQIVVDEEMLMGPRPARLSAEQRMGAPIPEEYTSGTGHRLLMVHGYCSSNVWGNVAGDFTNESIFLDLSQNRTIDDFAARILTFGNTWNSYGIVAHSQGGMAALHLYATRWSGLDNAGPGRLLQSVGTPYQGTPVAGILATLFGCGANAGLLPDGAALWLAGIPNSYRAKVNYYTTSFTDGPGYDYCLRSSDVFLSDPEDGIVEQTKGQLPGGVNRGHTTGQCHSMDMRDPAQYLDSARNTVMNANAPVGPPTMTTSAATGIGPFVATLNGTVNPNGASTTTAFEYGTTPSYGSTATAQTRSGSTSQSISATPSLPCETTYHFRSKGTNSAGTRYGADQTFTTSACPPALPTVTTTAATSIGQTVATMNGTVDPNRASTTTAFEYGTTQAYGITVAAQTRTGDTSQSISASPSLSCGTTYHYRARGTNSVGTSYGSNQSFITLPCAPTVNTNAASGIGQYVATLNGTVNPNGLSTTTAFDYGLTQSYGSSVAAQTLTGTTFQSISASVSLSCQTTYHYRAKGTSSGGTTHGSNQTFMTLPCTQPPPNVTTDPASGVGQFVATLNGTVNPNGSTATTAFEYGTSPAYGSTIAAQTRSGSSVQAISASPSLACATTYYFRATATSAGGTTYGNQQSFLTTTCPPNACTYSISPPSATGAGSGGTGNIQVSSGNGTCSGTWSASSGAPFLTLTGTTTGSGGGTWNVPFSYSANPSSSSTRQGTVTFTGAFPATNTFTLTQNPAPPVGGCTAIQPGIPVLLPPSSTPSGELAMYCLQVPASATSLTVAISGGTGDPDLYVRYGQPPTSSSYDCRPYLGGPAEDCAFSSPQAGTWYIGIDTFSPYSGTTLTATLTSPSQGQGRSFHTVTPCRVIDTRNPIGPSGGPALSSNGIRVVQVAGSCGIPASAAAVSVNVTAVGPPAAGWLTVYPTGTPLPSTSTINYRLGLVRANNAIIGLSPVGQLNVFSYNGVGATHFIIDVNGYFQ